MRQIIFLLLLDLLISVAVSAWLYFTRGVDAAFMTGLSIFISFSPICLVLAEPFTLYLAGKNFSKLDVTFNNAAALKILAEVDVVALPYNRVLTCNEYYITDLVPEGLKQSELLIMAASAEREAENILGQTIYNAAVSRGFRLQKPTEFNEFPGRGVEARIRGVLVRVGSPGWLISSGVAAGAIFRTKIDQLLVKGKSTLLVSTGRVARGIIALKDEINIDAKIFLSSLRQKKIESLLLTAQPKKMAYRIAKDFELDHIRTNLTPEGKAREIQIFRAKGKVVAVVGNDVHDLPALVQADVSFLLAGGSLNSAELKESKIDFEIPTLESFLSVQEIACKVIKVLKINRYLALLSWVFLVPPAFLSALENPPIPFNPLMAAAGVVIFSMIILANLWRIKIIGGSLTAKENL